MFLLSSVHIELSKKVNEKVTAIEAYKQMDQQREQIIEKLASEYKEGQKIDISSLNQWTQKMNDFAVKNQLPTRKIITVDMFKEYFDKL